MIYESTKVIELGSCAFRQWRATHSHCKYIHGYRLIAKFYFGCSQLDDKNWVVDFGGLKGLKEILEHQFDHTLCVAWDDPCMPEFRALHDKKVVDLRVFDHGVGIERTAEWCLIQADNFVRKETNGRCWVTKVEVWEHEKNSAIAIAVNDRVKGINYEKKYIAAQGEFNFNDKNNETISTTIQPYLEVANVVAAGVNVNTNGNAIPAQVGNVVSTGLNDPFKGTSWGNK